MVIYSIPVTGAVVCLIISLFFWSWMRNIWKPTAVRAAIFAGFFTAALYFHDLEAVGAIAATSFLTVLLIVWWRSIKQQPST